MSNSETVGLFFAGTWHILPDRENPGTVIATASVVDNAIRVIFSDFPGQNYHFQRGENGRWTINGWSISELSPSRTRMVLQRDGHADAVWVLVSTDWLIGNWLIEPDEMHPDYEYAEIRLEDGRCTTFFDEYPGDRSTWHINEEDGTYRARDWELVFVRSDRNTFILRKEGEADARYTRVLLPDAHDHTPDVRSPTPATCAICFDNFPLSSGISCGNAHFECNGCLDTHVTTSLGRPLGQILATPGVVPCATAPRCTAQFTFRDLCLNVPPSTFSLLMTVHTEAAVARSITEIEESLGTRNEIARHRLTHEQMEEFRIPLRNQQLRTSLRLLDGTYAAYQCGNCGFGPILHANCADLRAHHGQRVAEGVTVNNGCPRCQWFSDDISNWPRWNGEFQQTID